MSNPDPRSAARSLRDLIESEAEAVESASTMTAPVVDALVDAGLFRLLVPTAFGGHEADVPTIVDVCEELSFADGSVGWAFAQNTTVMAYAAYLAVEHARPLAEARAAAGMFAPLGIAEEEDGGYRVSGTYPFGSGSGHAEYMGGSAMVMRDGEMAPFDGALPQILGYIVPMDRVTLKGNWDVMGLRGTGSYDFEIPAQHVDAGMTFSVFQSTTVTGGPIYALGPVVLGTISSTAWAIGVAARALHEIAEIATGGRARLGAVPLREQPTFQRDFGRHMVALDGVRLQLTEVYSRAIETVTASDDPAARSVATWKTRAASRYVTEVAKEAVRFAWESSGSAGIRNPSRLQRCFRDIHVGAGHMVFDERNYIELAKTRLGIDPLPY